MDNRARIGLRHIRDLQPNATLWDIAVPGFGARRQKSEAVAYVLKYRTPDGRTRWHTIGRHGAPWTPDMARTEALRLLGEVVRGDDPAEAKQTARKAMTVAELCDEYLAEAEAGRLLVRGGRAKKPLTLASDRGRITGHIVPLIGRKTVRGIKRSDIEKMMHAIAAGATSGDRKTSKPRGRSMLRGGRGVATRTIGLTGAIFEFAIARGLREDNPAHRVRKYAEGRRERRLTDEEYARLGAGLRAAEATIWPPAVACLRFLALSGWRRNEAVGLRWGDVDLGRRVAILPDSKTGRSVRPLSHAACAIIAAWPRRGDTATVFRPARGDATMSGFPKFARVIMASAGLPPDITPHTLRHSFASLAGDLGLSESTIGAMIGHKTASITARYVHLADAPLLAAADRVADETLARMGEGRQAGAVVPWRPAGVG
jgi:integrase